MHPLGKNYLKSSVNALPDNLKKPLIFRVLSISFSKFEQFSSGSAYTIRIEDHQAPVIIGSLCPFEPF